MKKLDGKTAIVTGGGRDIGKAISLKLAKLGANIVVNYYGDQDAAEKTVAEITKAGGKAILFRGDMTKQDDVLRMIALAKETYGPAIDLLVNVAGGIVARKTLEEMDEDFFSAVVRLNLNSAFLTCKHATPLMSAGASIVNLASQAGRDGGGPGASAYATGKGALMTFTRAMAKELGPKGIRVNAVCPGMIATTFHDTFSKDEVRKNVAAATPLKREGQAEEVADLVVYLGSDEASFINGVCIDINGGLLFS
ncbi:oxidoreductase [Iodidimonas gelatinilytica]|uniref:Oxidoreductase n=1 Tax=Iodidimonas gelatinilytica TaxID=1236966 RepID=A0A5A7MZ17_9PROT|nr:glucose 1-dehydrogenase [Iodidimonas gelatinilytica]GER00330.1 oxidoreductase [Iodidimonas gelatinilytica]